MQVIIQTRFSYLGKSGWRSDASRDAAKLFDPARLEKRLALFEKITLASLKNQTDADFRLIVLSSQEMPKPYQHRLRTLVLNSLGPERVIFKFARPGYAAKKMAVQVTQAFLGTDWVAEVVLDDDDALATTYVSDLRASVAARSESFATETDYAFVTFPRGLSLFASQGKIAYANRLVPFTNLGLALVARPGSGRNIFAVAHLKIGARHPHFIIDTGAPYYVRSIHGANDSRGLIGAEPLSDTEATALVDKCFPFLAGLDHSLLAPIQESSRP